MVVALAVVLLVSRITEKQLRVVIETKVATNQSAILREPCVWQKGPKEIRWKTQKSSDSRVRIQTARRTQRAESPCIHVQQQPVGSSPVGPQRVSTEPVCRR